MYSKDIERLTKALVGAVFLGIDCRPGGTKLTIRTDRVDAVLGVSADCCSESWVDSIEAPDDVEGATITGLEEFSCDGRSVSSASCRVPPEYPDHIEAYQSLIRTTKGTVAIEYRNNSNGYYGGSLYIIELKTKKGEP